MLTMINNVVIAFVIVIATFSLYLSLCNNKLLEKLYYNPDQYIVNVIVCVIVIETL